MVRLNLLKGYLFVRPAEVEPLFPAFASILLFMQFHAEELDGYIVCGVAVALTLALARAPRAVLYAVLALGLLYFLDWHVHQISTGSMDAHADRDEAVEIGARALLSHQNPWRSTTQLGFPITTGPMSMFLAMPFVALTGHIEWLTFAMWCVFFGCLCWGDFRTLNQSFPLVCMWLLLPDMHFAATLSWALDELYYAMFFLPFVWILMSRERFFAAGALAACMTLSRLSYFFAILSVGLWWYFHGRARLRDYGRAALGALAVVACTTAALRLLVGRSIWRVNFLNTLLEEPLDTEENPLASLMLSMLHGIGHGSRGGALLVVCFSAAVAYALRAQRHPFVVVAFAMVAAHTIPFSTPKFFMNYFYMVLIPAMYSVAFAQRGHDVEIRTGAAEAIRHGDPSK